MHRLKEKLRGSDAKDAAYTAIGGLQRALDVFNDAAGDLGVPGLQKGITGLSTVLAMIQKSHGNSEDISDLAKKISDLTAMVKECAELHGSNISPKMQARVDRLISSWKSINDEAVELKSRNKLLRIIKADEEAEKIAGFVQGLSWSIQSFMVEGTLAIEFALDDHTRAWKESSQRVEKKLDTIQDDIQRLRMLSRPEGNSVPPYAVTARFDCRTERTTCLEGTRTDTLEDIFSWAIGKDTTNDSPASPDDHDSLPQPGIFWLNGLAGTGKTTIAYTVAEHCHERGMLGASFFCSRSDTDCSSPSMIFTTIAYQLGLFHKPHRDFVAEVLQKDPLVVYSSVSRQCDELIVKPLKQLRDSFPPCIVVIDALDECRDHQVTSAVLSTLLKHEQELSPIRFFLTSRPEQHIATSFDNSGYRDAFGKLLLHEVGLAAVTTDINRYLTVSLSEFRERYKLDEAWPAQEDVEALSRMANGLFIFAATAVKFIEDQNYNDPDGQLKILVSSGSSDGAHKLLDGLYLQVLESAFPDVSHGISGRVKSILGSIVIVKDPLPLSGLSDLLGFSSGVVYNSLMGLHSVLVVPDSEESTANVRIIHPTFAEFLLDPSRCTSRAFGVNSRQQHTLLLHGCLNALRNLKRDICDIRDPTLLNNEIPDLSSRLGRGIPPDLRYACQHWSDHLVHGELSEEILDALLDFAERRLLYWVEACSLLGVLREAIAALNDAQQKLIDLDRTWRITILFNDCERLIVGYFPAISGSALQLYHSVLAFMPRETTLTEVYASEYHEDSAVAVFGDRQELWDPCMGMVTAHAGSYVRAVAFSPDGKTVASSGDDCKIRIWDALNCTLLLVLPGHSDFARSLRYSPDSTRIVSAAKDGTIKIWDAVSGVLIRGLEGHTGDVSSITYTVDGKRLLSGSEDKCIKIWDVATGTCIRTLAEHQTKVNSIALSPDGHWMASSSDDGVFLWSLDNDEFAHRTLKPKDLGKTTYTVIFTPDSSELLCGPNSSFSGQLTAWDVKTAKMLRKLKPSGWPGVDIDCIDVPAVGNQFVCGSKSNSVIVLDLARGELRHVYPGHTNVVSAIACNREGTRIVSGSWDGTVRLWDVPKYTMNVAEANNWGWYSDLGGHTLSNYSAVFSHNGSLAMEGCNNWSVFVHKTDTWEWAYEYLSVGWGPRCLAFSPDDTAIITASADQGKVELWDTKSGRVRAKIPGTCHNTLRVPEISRDELGHPHLEEMLLWSGVLGYAPHCFGGHSSSMMFSRDSRFLVTGSVPKDLDKDDTMPNAPQTSACLWDVATGKRVREFVGHTGPVLCVAFSLGGERIVTGSEDKTINVWDTSTGQVVTTCQGHDAPVFAVAFSPNGEHVASGDEAGQIRIWETETAQVLQSFEGHSTPVWSLAFAPKGDIVISSSEDGTTRFWDRHSGTIILTLETDTWYRTIQLSADGSGLIIDGNETTLQLWAPLDADSQTTSSLPWLPRRIWPMYYIEDGWLISLAPSKRTRLCWVPADWQVLKGYHEQHVVFKHRHKLDLSGLTKYLDGLS